MTFRVHKDFDKWTKKFVGRKKDSKKIFNRDFDLYYLCFMAGIAIGKHSENPDSTDLVKFYPEAYKNKRDFFATALMVAESEIGGYKDRKLMKTLLAEYLDPESMTKLNESGERLMNDYAHEGFLYLNDKVNLDSRDDSFLADIEKFIREAFEDNPKWS